MTSPAATLPNGKVSSRITRTGVVFDLIRRGTALTTSDIAASMGVVRSTVTERLEHLMKLDLVVPAGETSPGRGRPAGIMAFNENAGVTLTAHLGMSGTIVAVTDLAGRVLQSNQVQLDVATGHEAMLQMLESEFRAALQGLDRAPPRIYGIGIGVPGDFEVAAAPFSWRESQIAERLSIALGAPAFVDRDVNFMALGEHRTSWPDARLLLCLKVGTVIACGIVIDGKVVQGASGLLGEIGHTKVPGSEAACSCGSRGCLNAVAGGRAIADKLRASGFETHTARDIARLANQGAVPVGQAVRAAGRQVGDVVAAAVNLLNPDVVTAWGYLVDAGDQFLAGMLESIYNAALPSSARALSVTQAQLGDDIGVRGAALAVVEHALAPDAIDAMVSALADS